MSDEVKLLTAAADPAVFNIVQLVYHSPTYERQSKDYEFSRRTMEDHWAAGYRDATRDVYPSRSADAADHPVRRQRLRLHRASLITEPAGRGVIGRAYGVGGAPGWSSNQRPQD